jgi:hypothetical protein
MKKQLTASVATSQPPPSPEDAETKAADGAAAAAFSGLDLLFAASQSQVETTKPKPNDKEGAKAEADGAGVPLPSSTTVVSKGGNAKGESGRSSDGEESSSSEYDDENPAADAISIKKTFPQVLQEILSTPELHPIAHWLPDGFSFIIANKQRFSDEILPKYFRESLFRSFIRKLNHWGFRRVKRSRCKGDESSSTFVHNKFVRDKPWLCLKMSCKSKPSYHKVPSAKKKAHQQQAAAAAAAAAAEATSTDSLANAARNIAVHVQAPPSLLAACGSGMVDASSSRAFVPTCLRSISILPSAAAAAGSHNIAAVANTIQESPQQRLFRERQILMFQMRQYLQLRVELQRLHEMSSNNEDQFVSSYVQRAQYTRDMLHRNRNIFYGGER